RRGLPASRQSSVSIRRWGAAGLRPRKARPMLFKPDPNGKTTVAGDRATGFAGRARRRIVSSLVTLLILGGLGYIGWTTFKQTAQRNVVPDLPVPVLAATPQQKDVPVYLDGVGVVKALNTVTVRAQVDGK